MVCAYTLLSFSGIKADIIDVFDNIIVGSVSARCSSPQTAYVFTGSTHN